jgi:hydroxymethylpyrimidine/phosphomethylpyrimidine kinase
MRHALTIAGSDSGGARIQGDLKTFAVRHGTSAITAVTQNTWRHRRRRALSRSGDRTNRRDRGRHPHRRNENGMLATAAIVEAVASAIEELELPLVVLDR